MSIQLLFFAQAAQWMGIPRIQIDAPEGTSLRELLKRERTRLFPVIERLNVLRVAVNERFTGLETPLHDGDEVAFLPPVSGG